VVGSSLVVVLDVNVTVEFSKRGEVVRVVVIVSDGVVGELVMLTEEEVVHELVKRRGGLMAGMVEVLVRGWICGMAMMELAGRKGSMIGIISTGGPWALAMLRRKPRRGTVAIE
jgi:hypothetical protein